MTAWMVEALNPNLLQSIEGQPVFVHAGPFANIAIGQSSIIADRVGLKLADYHVTESGFGADIGFEKFWNLKCRFSGLKPNCAVVVATIRALKCHGGAPVPRPGLPMPKEYEGENVGWVGRGMQEPGTPYQTVKMAGINPVVCINSFYTDTKDEIAAGQASCPRPRAPVAAVSSEHWLKGGDGALEFADAVVDACEEKNEFKLLYDLSLPLRQRIELIAKEVYGADGVTYTAEAEAKGQEDGSRSGVCQARNLHGQDPPEPFS